MASLGPTKVKHREATAVGLAGCVSGGTFTIFRFVKNSRKWEMGLCGADSVTICHYRAVKGLDTTQALHGSDIS
jgi:hypothetical protein